MPCRQGVACDRLRVGNDVEGIVIVVADLDDAAEPLEMEVEVVYIPRIALPPSPPS